MASSISSVSVDFVANVAKYISGLDTMASKTKSWSDKTKRDTQGATDAFDGTSKAINNLAKNLLAIVAIEKIGAAFSNAAKQVAQLADEAEKVGASAAQFDKLRLAAERNGANIDDVKLAYKELQKSVNEALGGTKETIKAFDALGLSYSYLAGLNPDERFSAIAQALSQVSDENKRAEVGVRLLGKAYTELSPLIAKGAGGIESGGRGGLSQGQIEGVDKITKAFEELGRTLDLKIKKSLADASDSIIKIVNGLQYLIDNLGAVAKLVAVAFAPLLLFRFSQYLGETRKKLLDLLAEQSKIAKAAAAGQTIRPGLLLPEGELKSLRDFKALLTSIGGVALTLSIVLGKIVASVAALGAGLEIGLQASIWTAQAVGAEKYAQGVEAVRSVFHDWVLETLGFETQSSKTKDFLAKSNERIAAAQKRLADTANQAGQALDSEAQYVKDLEDAFKSAEQAALNFATATTEKFKSPYEKAKEEMNKLTLAVDRGRITVDVYKKAVADLAAGLSQLDLDKLRRAFVGGGPFGALGVDTGPSISDQQRFSARGAGSEIFGAGTLQGLPKGMTLPSISINEDEKKRIESLGKTLTEQGKSATEVYNQRVKDIEAASVAVDEYGKSVLSAEGKTKALTDATTQFAQSQADAFAATTPYWEEAVGLTQNFADGLASAITEGKNFGDALKGVFQDILKQILMLTIRTAILQSIMAAVGLASAPAALAFGQMTGIVGKAAGGPVVDGKAYKVGEAGPEMFVPSQNGYIVPNNMNNNSQPTVIQNITIQTGVAQTIRAELAAAMPRFKSEAIAGVLDAKNRGGSYSKGLAAA